CLNHSHTPYSYTLSLHDALPIYSQLFYICPFAFVVFRGTVYLQQGAAVSVIAAATVVVVTCKVHRVTVFGHHWSRLVELATNAVTKFLSIRQAAIFVDIGRKNCGIVISRPSVDALGKIPCISGSGKQ